MSLPRTLMRDAWKSFRFPMSRSSLNLVRQHHQLWRPDTALTTPTHRLVPVILFKQSPLRHNSTSSSPSQSSSQPAQSNNNPQRPLPPGPIPETPSYALTFTCKPCGTRSSHYVSKQGYHKGSVLIACPNSACLNRHVVSDHLHIFTEGGGDLEAILQRHGAQGVKNGVKKGVFVKGAEGKEGGSPADVEFWDDGTVVKREVAPGVQ